MAQVNLFAKRPPGRTKEDSRYEVLFDPPAWMDKFETEKIIIHLPKVEEMIVLSTEAYLKKKGLFQIHSAKTAPQNMSLPIHAEPESYQFDFFKEETKAVAPPSIKRGSTEHFRWLFYAAGSDKRQVSDHVYRCHSNFYRKHPEYYSGAATHEKEKDFARLLSSFRFGLPDSTPKGWILQSRSLECCFKGSVPALISEVKTVEGMETLRRRLSKEWGWEHFWGYGPKITSLLFLFLAETGKFKMPMDACPIDVHGQRIPLQIGAVVLKSAISSTDHLEPPLRRLYCHYAQKHRFSTVDVAHALWLRGSKNCNGCSTNKEVSHLCELYSRCRGPVGTMNYFKLRMWDHPLEFGEKGSDRTFNVPPGSFLLNTA